VKCDPTKDVWCCCQGAELQCKSKDFMGGCC